MRKTKLFSKHIPIKIKTSTRDSGKRNIANLKIFAISVNQFRKLKEIAKVEDRQLSVIGQTKLKQLSEEQIKVSPQKLRGDAILLVRNRKNIEGSFEIKSEYRYSRVVGYLPVGDDQFVAVVSVNPIYFLALLLVLLCLGLGIYVSTRPQQDDPEINRYIEEVETSDTNTDSTSTRYRLNTTLTVVNSTIQNLNFENINEGKYLRIKIKLDYENDTDYIYDSELVPFGKKITADTLLRSDVPAGTYQTIAECYSYSLEKVQLAQTNFVITLIVK